jgi:hypothetical protein
MMIPTHVCCVSSISLLFTLSLGAQPADWSNLESIAHGAEIRVDISRQRPVQGSLQAVTADAVTLNSPSGQQTLGRSEVLQVSLKKTSHRKRNALIGLAGGVGVGAGIGLAARCTGFCPVSTGEITAVTTVAGALVGTVVGVVIPTGGWQKIYQLQARR